MLIKLTIITFFVYLFACPTNLQLLINVRNQGGDVLQENIIANVSEDTVTLEFLRLDGVFVSQLVDFTNEVEAVKVVIPGEEELGQIGHQALCFLTHAAQADFIAPDAMAKLRQECVDRKHGFLTYRLTQVLSGHGCFGRYLHRIGREESSQCHHCDDGHEDTAQHTLEKNPGTVRVAEEDKGWRQTTATAWAARATRLLSTAAARHCAAAGERVYLRAADLARWAPRPGLDQSSFPTLVTAFPAHALAAEGAAAVPPCAADTDPAQECICHLEVCVNWYPCGLKYCKGKPQGGLSYRCGIKTCHRCYRYHFYMRRRDSCLSVT